MTPAVDRCLPFAFEITLGKITAVDGTAVFTESIAVSRPFVSDVSLVPGWVWLPVSGGRIGSLARVVPVVLLMIQRPTWSARALGSQCSVVPFVWLT